MRSAVLTSCVIAGSLLFSGAPAFAAQDRTVDAAMAAARRKADCPVCSFRVVSDPGAGESARRGLVTVNVHWPDDGGYEMTMAYTGSRWGLLWEGNGTPRNLQRLPGRIAICMDKGGWTNLRKGPGLNSRRVGKVSNPTITRAFEVRLTDVAGRRREGVAWYRISYHGRPAWVQNLRTVQVFSSAAESCRIWRTTPSDIWQG